MSAVNPFLLTDVYKMGHMEQYPKGTKKVYSYLVARSGEKLPDVLFFGLQAILKQYLTIKPKKTMVKEFLQYRKDLLGLDLSPDLEAKLYALVDLGYFPLQVKAVREGTIVPVKNALMTITNTHPDYPWLVGFFESLLLKVWNTCTVASFDLKLRRLVTKFAKDTCDNELHLPFQVHDFGYRGCSSEETAASSGACHLINFLGTDTVPALKWVKENYAGVTGPLGLSVPASEHSVMCAFGEGNELAAFENMLDLYPSGVISVVSDTYNLWNVLTTFAEKLKPRIMAREGGPAGFSRFVFRPDSGNPETIICGDPLAPRGSPERKGALELLGEAFGYTLNSKGFKVLNPKVGLIYGDGIYYERFERILTTMWNQGWASSNLVVGIGGLLLQQHNRDEQGYAIKATYAEIETDGKLEERELMKDPVTDHKKKSHKGLVTLLRDTSGHYHTLDRCHPIQELSGLLETVFLDGKLVNPLTFDEIRARVTKQLQGLDKA